MCCACRKFGYEGPFWGREYTLWHKGKAVALVQEVFSPAMEEYLGPTFTWARSVKTRGLDSLGLVASTDKNSSRWPAGPL